MRAGPARVAGLLVGVWVLTGCVHNADEKWTWFGPNAWRTRGDDWSYEYQLKPMGVLVAPQLLVDDA